MAAKKAPKKTGKSKPVRNSARKLKVASGIIAGTPITQIAAEEGVSRATAHRDAASPEVRQILTILISDKIILLESLLRKALTVIEDAFGAQILTATKEGRVVTVGPDHYARLAAAKRFIELTTAGRPVPKAPEPPPDRRRITLTEFEEILQQYRQHNSATSGAPSH